MPRNDSKPSVVIDESGLERLIDGLHRSGYEVIGPTVRDGSIVYDAIQSTRDLPRGWTDIQVPGSYRLERSTDEALFGYNVGPHTWKQFLFPPRERVWQLTIKGDRFERTDSPPQERPLAFLGVRACELAAITIQDKVFIGGDARDEGYASRRESAVFIAVNCGQAGGTCFCDSMGAGPRADEGFDLAMTELMDDGRHAFLVEIGSKRGEALIADVPSQSADDHDHAMVDEAEETARGQMGRSMQAQGLPELIGRNLEHPVWDEIAGRCLACANCTMVCPTCFCHSLEDTSDLSGEIAERWRRWDSCFNGDFSYIHGGRVRASTASRYRQWMSHKLSTWHDQFGTSGCVGCGRCITWCPVGIDITAEAQAIRDRDGETSA